MSKNRKFPIFYEKAVPVFLILIGLALITLFGVIVFVLIGS